jgi:hypothetical protein
MANDKEPDWTKDISNETLCRYFYVLFFIVTVSFGLIFIWYLTIPKVGWKLALGILPTSVIAILNTLFFYILCSRALLK